MHRYDFNETTGKLHFYEEDLDEDFEGEEEVELDLDLDEDGFKRQSKVVDSKGRRSVDEYLEKKRLRQRYKDLFDDYFGESS